MSTAAGDFKVGARSYSGGTFEVDTDGEAFLPTARVSLWVEWPTTAREPERTRAELLETLERVYIRAREEVANRLPVTP